MEPAEKKSCKEDEISNSKSLETLGDCDGDSLVCNFPKITVPPKNPRGQGEYIFTTPFEHKKWQDCDRKLLVEMLAKKRCGLIDQAVAATKLQVDKSDIIRWGKELQVAKEKMSVEDKALRYEVLEMCQILAQKHIYPPKSTHLHDPGKVAGMCENKKWSDCPRKLLIEVMAKTRCGLITQAVAGRSLGVDINNICRWTKDLDSEIGKMTVSDEELRREILELCEILSLQEKPAKCRNLEDPKKVAKTTRKYRFWTELDRKTLEDVLMRVNLRKISKSEAARELGVSHTNIGKWLARINSGGKLSAPGRRPKVIPQKEDHTFTALHQALDQIIPSVTEILQQKPSPENFFSEQTKYPKMELPKKKFRVVKVQNKETGKIVSQLIPIIDVDIDDDDAKSVMSMKSNASLNASRKLVKRAMQFRPVCPIQPQVQEPRISAKSKCDPEFVVAILLALGNRTLDVKKASKLLGKSEEIVNAWIKELDKTFERPGREMMRTPTKSNNSFGTSFVPRSPPSPYACFDDVIPDESPVKKSLLSTNKRTPNSGNKKHIRSHADVILDRADIIGLKTSFTSMSNLWAKTIENVTPVMKIVPPKQLPDLREGLPAPYVIHSRKLTKSLMALEENDGTIRLYHFTKIQNLCGKSYYRCANCGLRKRKENIQCGAMHMLNNKVVVMQPHAPGCVPFTKEQVLVMDLTRQTKARVQKYGVDPNMAFEHCWREIMVTAKEKRLRIEGEGGVKEIYDKIDKVSMKGALRKASMKNEVAETEEAMEKEGDNIAELTSDVDPPFLMLSKHLQKNDLVINHSNSYSYIYSYHGRSRDYKKTFYKCPHCRTNSKDRSKGVAHTMDGNLVYESRHIEGCAQFSKEQMLCLQMERNAKFRTFKYGNEPPDSYDQGYRELLRIARDEGLRVHGTRGVKELFVSRSKFLHGLRHWRRKRRLIAEKRGIAPEDVDMAVQNFIHDQSEDEEDADNANETSNGISSQTDSHYFIHGGGHILKKDLVRKCEDGRFRLHKHGSFVRSSTRGDMKTYLCYKCCEVKCDRKNNPTKPGKVLISLKSNKIVSRSAHILDCEGISREEILAIEHSRDIKFNVFKRNMNVDKSWQEEKAKMLAKAEAENLDINGEFGVLAYFQKTPILPHSVRIAKKSFIPVNKSSTPTLQNLPELSTLTPEFEQLSPSATIQVENEQIDEDPFIGPHLGFSAKLTKTLLIVPHEDKTVRIYNRVRMENSAEIQLELFNYQCPRCTMIKKDEEDLVATAIFSEGQVFKESLHHKSCDSYSREQITCTQIERQAKFNVVNHGIGCGNAWKQAKTVLVKLAGARNYDIKVLESQFVDLKTFIKQCIKLMEKQHLNSGSQKQNKVPELIPEINPNFGVETEIVQNIE